MSKFSYFMFLGGFHLLRLDEICSLKSDFVLFQRDLLKAELFVVCSLNCVIFRCKNCLIDRVRRLKVEIFLINYSVYLRESAHLIQVKISHFTIRDRFSVISHYCYGF